MKTSFVLLKRMSSTFQTVNQLKKSPCYLVIRNFSTEPEEVKKVSKKVDKKSDKKGDSKRGNTEKSENDDLLAFYETVMKISE